MEQIKCRLCDGDAELKKDEGTLYPYRIECLECGSQTNNYSTRELALNAWKKRYEIHVD